MAGSPAPQNRKERRAQARKNVEETQVPLASPNLDGPKQKTLLNIAAERQLLAQSTSAKAGLESTQPAIVNTIIKPDGTISQSTEPAPETSLNAQASPWLEIILYTVSLTLLHFTLTLLVTNQYSSTPPQLLPLFLSSTVFSRTPPLLLLMVSILHPRAGHPVLQIGFVAMAITCGTYLVKISNEDPYIAVMKQAPELGTLWVWSVVECRWESALVGMAAVGSWGRWKGYSFW